VDPFVPAMRALLLKDACLKATVIAERVGFNGGVSTTVFRERVATLKQELGVVDPADRLVFAPGEQVQCDLWFPQTKIIETGAIHPVLTMIACWSRFLLALMIPTRVCGDILGGMNVLLARLGGLPERVLWDNEAGIVHQHRLIPQASAWAGGMGALIKLAKPRDPETKGRIERANGYLDSSFEPARTFTSIADFNTQLDEWLELKANRRWVRATGAKPADLLDDERYGMVELPTPLPPGLIEQTIRLPRDYHIRVGGCDYSIDPTAIGRIITVKASLTRVWATCAGQNVADHQRCFKARQTITDPNHVAKAALLRTQFQDAQHMATTLEQAPIVEHRDLASYDQLWQEAAA